MQDGREKKRRRLHAPDSGEFILRKVLDDIPLVGDDTVEDVAITCVELWSRYEQHNLSIIFF